MLTYFASGSIKVWVISSFIRLHLAALLTWAELSKDVLFWLNERSAVN